MSCKIYLLWENQQNIVPEINVNVKINYICRCTIKLKFYNCAEEKMINKYLNGCVILQNDNFLEEIPTYNNFEILNVNIYITKNGCAYLHFPPPLDSVNPRQNLHARHTRLAGNPRFSPRISFPLQPLSSSFGPFSCSTDPYLK